jgi:putative SOS response-associated peptidase YedK
MPVILQSKDYEEWLDTAARTPDTLNHLMKEYPANLMEAYPVSTLVNTPKNDRVELIAPV